LYNPEPGGSTRTTLRLGISGLRKREIPAIVPPVPIINNILK